MWRTSHTAEALSYWRCRSEIKTVIRKKCEKNTLADAIKKHAKILLKNAKGKNK